MLTIQISTNTALKTPSLSRASTRLLTQQPGVRSSLFLTATQGTTRLPLKKSDQEKTSFIMLFGAYCYNTMTFGLKNLGATYQKAIQKCLQGQIGHSAEAYIDDIVIKTRSNDQFIADLQETFENLR